MKLSFLARDFSDEINQFYIKSMKDNEIDSNEYIDLVKIYEDYKKHEN